MRARTRPKDKPRPAVVEPIPAELVGTAASSGRKRGGSARASVPMYGEKVFARVGSGLLKETDPAYVEGVKRAVWPLHGMEVMPAPEQEHRRIAAHLFQRPPVFIGTEETQYIPGEWPNRLEVSLPPRTTLLRG